jgi:SAM-dependent methyltransferase
MSGPVPGRRVALGATAPTGIGDILFSPRSFREYRAMFALTGDDLAGRLLDCAGGAASFAAAVADRAGDVRACDPAYTSSPDDLDARSAADLARAAAYVHSHPDEYAWSFFADFDTYKAERGASRAAFVADYTAHRERYVAGRLPHLPFRAGSFDLVLCSHLLFSWSDRLDLDFHLAAIGELARVGRVVRIFPLFAMGAGPPLDLDPLLARLRRRGLIVEKRPVDYQFQRGRPVMLQVTAGSGRH